MDIVFIFVVLIILWIASILLLSAWKHFYKFILLNSGIIITYLCIIKFGGDYIWGHDEYGLGKILMLIFSLFLHTIISFIFALYINYTLRSNETTT
jgi:hypothetical protein